MKNCLNPLSDKGCTILILGSLPGELSLDKQQYYAHSRNAFWKIMYEILDEDFSDDYTQKCNMLLQHNIALWDVIHSAERVGSLDNDIKNEIVNDFNTFLNQHTKITKIFINGGKAFTLWKKYCSNINIPVVGLPSTSPANARTSFDEKLKIWRDAITKI